MLDIGFSELLLIAVAAIVFIGPKDLPVVIRHVAKCMRELRGFYLGAKQQAMQLADEAGLHDLHQNMTTIIDLEGKPQQAYDVRDLERLRGSSTREASAPLPAGEAGLLSVPKARFSNPGEGAVEQVSSRPHPDLLPHHLSPNFISTPSHVPGEVVGANPTSPAGRGTQAAPLQAKKSHD